MDETNARIDATCRFSVSHTSLPRGCSGPSRMIGGSIRTCARIVFQAMTGKRRHIRQQLLRGIGRQLAANQGGVVSGKIAPPPSEAPQYRVAHDGPTSAQRRIGAGQPVRDLLGAAPTVHIAHFFEM